MSEKDGGPAFPSLKKLWNSNRGIKASDFTAEIVGGLSIRDYFAGMALQGWLAGEVSQTHREIAKQAYKIADAMLKERAK
jgi:hypothetical protein